MSWSVPCSSLHAVLDVSGAGSLRQGACLAWIHTCGVTSPGLRPANLRSLVLCLAPEAGLPGLWALLLPAEGAAVRRTWAATLATMPSMPPAWAAGRPPAQQHPKH